MIYACMSDIHGRGTQLLDCLNAVEQFKKDHPREQVKLVFLGDYCDRGTENLLVLDTIMDIKNKYPDSIIIFGNHEEFFVGTFDYGSILGTVTQSYNASPTKVLNIWTYSGNGGDRTIAELKPYFNPNDEMCNAKIDGYVNFLKSLPDRVQENNFIFTHAPIESKYFRRDVALESIPNSAVRWNIDTNTLPKKFRKFINVHGHVHRQAYCCLINPGTCTINVCTYPNLSVTFLSSDKPIEDTLIWTYQSTISQLKPDHTYVVNYLD